MAPTDAQSVALSPAPIWHPPLWLAEVAAPRDPLGDAVPELVPASTASPAGTTPPPSSASVAVSEPAPASATGEVDGAPPPFVVPSAPPHAKVRRSELGGVQAFVQPASTVLSPESEEVSGKATPPQVIWHSHVHVEGQSESTVHGGVCSATVTPLRNVLSRGHDLSETEPQIKSTTREAVSVRLLD
jgi:hypothetical protein